jgi:guanine deaminase
MNAENDQRWMMVAIEAACRGIAAGQSPFGACLVKDDVLLHSAHNTVWQSCDATAHAEINAIRHGCARLRTIDLSGCTMYSTTEPCPMCFAACHWARIDRIVYGATIADAIAAGFHELNVSCEHLRQHGGSPVRLTAGVLAETCVALFRQWRAAGHARAY